MSDPVLQDHHPHRYKAFFVCNTTAFVASLVIIVLLLDKNLIKDHSKKNLSKVSTRFVALYGFIGVALFGLVGAYIAGSSREHDNTIYVACLAAAILIYQVAVVGAIHYSNQKKKEQMMSPQVSKWNRSKIFIVSKFMASGKTNEKETPNGSRYAKQNSNFRFFYFFQLNLSCVQHICSLHAS